MTLLQRYVTYRIASNTVFYLPVLILIFRLRLDSIELALALVSVYTVAVAITELPSGMIADTLGHKTALAMGLAAALIGTLLLAVSQSFLPLASAQLFIALAFSLRSGTESVYLFDLMPDQTLYQRYEGRTSAANYLALGISSAAGSLLYSLHALAPFALTFMAVLIALAFLLSLPNPEYHSSTRRPSPLEVVRQAGLSLLGRRGSCRSSPSSRCCSPQRRSFTGPTSSTSNTSGYPPACLGSSTPPASSPPPPAPGQPKD